MTAPLLIVGASARAAAFSARRAGIEPIGADLFADRDLRACCPVRRLAAEDYPRGLRSLPEWNEPGPWLYTGAVENHPGLVAELERRRPLWGNGAAVLYQVRKPAAVARRLREAGLPCPAVRAADDPPKRDGRWIVKPLASAGGAGVRLWTDEASQPRRPSYFQEFITGQPSAALYVADGQRAQLLGVTEQLIGVPWLHAGGFHYCGSIGPLLLPASQQGHFARLGQVLAEGFGLRGLFGVDCVLHDGVPWPVEVNPRYTASVEVIERATGIAALALHRSVFEPEGEANLSCVRSGERETVMGRGSVSRSPQRTHEGAPLPLHATPLPQGSNGPCIGKAILFARAALDFPDELPEDTADIPAAGERIEAGRPILTFFVRAATLEACRAALRNRALDLDRRLRGG